MDSPKRTPINLTPEFFSACDPDVSFDGKTILFSGKKSQDEPWEIWRMNRDGSEKVQVTKGIANNFEPLHVGARFYLDDKTPTDQMVFINADHGWINENGFGPAYSLYASDLRGNNIHRITFNLSMDFSPDVLPNGRVIFSSLQRYGSRFSPNGIYALMAVNIDGTDLMSYYGNFEAPIFKEMVRVSNNDRVYFIETNEPSWLRGGDLSFVSRRRPLKTHQVLSHDRNGFYHSPCPLPNSKLLASYRLKSPESTYGIYRISTQTGQRISSIYQEDGWHSMDAHALVPHPRVEGRSTWVNYNKQDGVFYCLDSYKTDRPEGRNLLPGSIKRLRVIEGLPISLPRNEFRHVSGNLPGPKRILGVVPVENDGSFHIKVPAETPITFQLLDENNLTLQTQHSWSWVMPNESRGCVGCHENRELSPPNRLTDAIIKPPLNLTLPSKQRRMIDFRNEIAPILDSKCSISGCHSQDGVTPYLDVSQVSQESKISEVYGSLLSEIKGSDYLRYVFPGNARESPLIWILFGKRLGSLDTTFTDTINSTHSPNLLTPNELIQFIEWIDLGAQWDTRASVAVTSWKQKPD